MKYLRVGREARKRSQQIEQLQFNLTLRPVLSTETATREWSGVPKILSAPKHENVRGASADLEKKQQKGIAE
jgi:hypothetical protein